MQIDIEVLKEACSTYKCTPSLSCKDITLLINACAEAAQYRRDHNMPHAEKYDAMQERLSKLSEKLDEDIDAYAKRLAAFKKKKHK